MTARITTARNRVTELRLQNEGAQRVAESFKDSSGRIRAGLTREEQQELNEASSLFKTSGEQLRQWEETFADLLEEWGREFPKEGAP